MIRRYLAALLVATLGLAGCGGHHTSTSSTSSTSSTATTPAPPAPAGHQKLYRTPQGPSAHSPTFGLPPKGLQLPRPQTLTSTAEMYDSVTLSVLQSLHLPSAAYAGYTSGLFPTYPHLLVAFPHSVRIVSIAISASHTSFGGKPVYCMDVEPGDAVAAQAGPWAVQIVHLGGVPCIYANLSTMAAVRASLSASHLARSQYRLWVALWVFHPQLVAGYDAQQWTDRSRGLNLDESTVSRAFLGVKPPPKPDPLAPLVRTRFAFSGGRVHASEYNTARTWKSARCRQPVRREVCKSSDYHLRLLTGRIYFVAHHTRDLKHAVRKPRWSDYPGHQLGTRYAILTHLRAER